MDATKAMIYCLKSKREVSGDGYITTDSVRDHLGDAHWITWLKKDHDVGLAIPQLASSGPFPFAKMGEPYKKI